MEKLILKQYFCSFSLRHQNHSQTVVCRLQVSVVTARALLDVSVSVAQTERGGVEWKQWLCVLEFPSFVDDVCAFFAESDIRFWILKEHFLNAFHFSQCNSHRYCSH